MRQNAKNGFTLVEILVAVGLFAVVMTIVTGAYLTLIAASRQSQTIATGVDNASFALEKMTRSILSGSEYSCGSDLGDGNCYGGDYGTSFTFKDVNNRKVTYRIDNGVIQEIIDDGTPVDLTDPTEVDVTALSFQLSGSAPTPTDYVQPVVTIHVSGTVSAGKGVTKDFYLGSFFVMRSIDIGT